MLWVLKRTVSMRRFFWAPKHMFKMMDKKIIAILRSNFLLNWLYLIIFSKYLPYSINELLTDSSSTCTGFLKVASFTSLVKNSINPDRLSSDYRWSWWSFQQMSYSCLTGQNLIRECRRAERFIALTCTFMINNGPVTRKPVFVACEHQRRSRACAHSQSDKHLWYLLYGKYYS